MIWSGNEEEEVKSMSSSSSGKFQEMELFRIGTMYRLTNDQIQFTGDLYVRRVEGDDFKDLERVKMTRGYKGY